MVGKVVRCQPGAFIGWKRMVFPQYTRAVALLYCGLSKLHFSQVALETCFCGVENSSRMGREVRKGTVGLHTSYFQPVMGVVLQHEETCAPGFWGNRPSWQRTIPGGKTCAFPDQEASINHIRRSIYLCTSYTALPAGEKHLCISFLKIGVSQRGEQVLLNEPNVIGGQRARKEVRAAV